MRSWVQHNPNTLKAFLAALEQGQQIADTSRSAVEQAMESLKGPMNGQVPSIVAAVMALNIYPIGIDAARLQRVPDVMAQFGLLHTRFNISQMIGP
jgi:NitT/TauT family transport system substrate-binding protein